MNYIRKGLEVIKNFGRRRAYPAVFLFLSGLLLGFAISVIFIKEPKIGVITISEAIISQKTVDDIVQMITYAKEDSQIKGVVIRVDSPGGGVAAIEEIYLNLLSLKKDKPIVASIGIRAVSGGYYIAAASNFIYCKPTSLVGGIGALVRLPKPEELREDIMTSGPFKETGGLMRHWISALDMVKEAFIQAVISQRGKQLRIDATQLSEARIYLGMEAIKLGLVDKLGTDKEAEEKAAALAGVRKYKLVNINKELKIYPPSLWFSSLEEDIEKSISNISPRYYYLYIEQR